MFDQEPKQPSSTKVPNSYGSFLVYLTLKTPIATQVVCFSRLLKRFKASMAHSLDPDQTAPLGAVCSGSTLFACILKFANNVRQLFAADDSSRRHCSDAFFLAL